MNKTARIGENVTFKCIELFSPVLTDYRWLHWKRLPPSYPELELNNNEPSLNSSYYTIIDPKHYQPFTFKPKEEKYGGRVLLNNVTEEDAGMYTCLISNQIGKGWRNAWLTVITSGKCQCLRCTDLLQVVNFTGLLQSVKTLQHTCHFHQVAKSLLKTRSLQLVICRPVTTC